MEGKIINYLAAFVIFISSCSSFGGSGESTDYNKEGNLYRKKIRDYTFTLKPFTSDKLAAINYGKENLSEEERDSVLKEYDDLICFVFEIDIAGFKEAITEYDEPGKESDYDKKVSYYLFDMQKDLSLKDEQGNETPCTVFYHERMNMITQTNRFIIGFKRPATGDAFLQYNNPYLNCGNVNFSINEQHLALK